MDLNKNGVPADVSSACVGCIVSVLGGCGFVITMLQAGVWFKFCPSMWLFERAGYKKTKI